MVKKIATMQVKVRMPKALHRQIQRDAERGGQTINAEILKRLATSADDLKRVFTEAHREFMDSFEERYREAKEKAESSGTFDEIIGLVAQKYGVPKDTVILVLNKLREDKGSKNERTDEAQH